MTAEIKELINLFAIICSGDQSNIQNASSKITELSTKPNYAINLLSIIMNRDIDNSVTFSAAIQLKNTIDKYWQRSTYFSENDKNVIRSQILNCAAHLEYKSNKFYNLLADIISKISRSDWNEKWPNLFNDLFSNDDWLIIYRVCQIQSTRRLSQGIVLFKELALVLSRQIVLKWKIFLNNFESKLHSSQSFSDLFNITYQLRTMGLFIRNSHLLVSEDEEFCNTIHNLSLEICSFFPNILRYYSSRLILSNADLKMYFCKFLKSMVWILLSYQNKVPNKLSNLTKEIQILCLVTIFNSNILPKSDRLTLLFMNLLLNTLRYNETNNVKNTIFDLQVIRPIQLKFLVQTEDEVEDLNNTPESSLESPIQKEDSIILYKIDDVFDEIFVLIVKCISRSNLSGIMEMVEMYFTEINSMSISDLESFLHFVGIIIQSCYYADSCHIKKCATLLNCPIIVENITNRIMNCGNTKVLNGWENAVIRRCVWLLSKWVIDDPNLGSISMDRIISSCQWCFKIAQSSVGVNIEVVLFIEHIIEALDKLPSDFVETQIMQEVFLSPSISIVVSLLDVTFSSDSHARLIEILIKLLNATNMWNNIDLVKTCANSIYTLWNGITCLSNETMILQDRLLECLSTIVKSCNPVVIQPILATLSIFINDALQLMVKPNNNTKCGKNSDICSILLDNTLQLWHDIVYNCEESIEGLDNIYSLIVLSDVFDRELDKNQTTLLLEIIQAHFLLKVIGSMSSESFSSLTFSSWNYIMKQPWNAKCEEDLCVMRIQLFDLWLLGSQQLSVGPISSLMGISSYCQFLCDRTKELFSTTNEEPSSDQHVCIVNSILTVLARICLFDRSMLKNLLQYLSKNEAENQTLVIGLLNRWLLRIDNQSSCSIQQLFVLACIQWIPCCFETNPDILSSKLETLINCCIQICSNVPTTNVAQNTEIAKAITIPAERHLQLAYIVWNPLTNYTSEIKKLVKSLMEGLNNSVGLDNFQNMFNTLDPVVQNQFIQLCTTSN